MSGRFSGAGFLEHDFLGVALSLDQLTAAPLSRSGPDGTQAVRAMPVGAELQSGGGVHFRIWAPKAHQLTIHVDGKDYPASAEDDGYFSLFVKAAAAGSRYGLRIDGNDRIVPDPASRWQPDGPHGLSCVADPSAYRWHDDAWRGARLDAGHVIYEFHVGTFTPQGTWRSAMEKLPLLADLGVTLLEMMPVAEFPGQFGWGYDGVSAFAPAHLYGEPDDLRAFIDAAHRHGLAVILDVVYNHFGPDGNYLPCFSDFYLAKENANEWGDAVNFDRDHSPPVREFVRENAAYWVREFHFDGLRLDATHEIYDASSPHILADLTTHARAAARDRDVVIIAENEPQHSRLVRPADKDGYGLDGIWMEDFHHACRVAMTGSREAYFIDFTGTVRELAAAVRYGTLYQGQRSQWLKKRRGSPQTGVDPAQRITFLENHDQVANSADGERLISLTDRRLYRAFTGFFFLVPGTPMLFQGQEFASPHPFLFFADHNPELALLVAKGRGEFLSQFASVDRTLLDPPHDRETFRKSTLDWSFRDRNAWAVDLHRDLIKLKRADPVIRNQGRDGVLTDIAGESVVLIRYPDDTHGDRLIVLNIWREQTPEILAQPLLAPPEGKSWRLLWSSEYPAYGGNATPELEDAEGVWRFAARTCALLSAS
jgi:maltooligosyltrehalose trehalohydrolase